MKYYDAVVSNKGRKDGIKHTLCPTCLGGVENKPRFYDIREKKETLTIGRPVFCTWPGHQ